MCNESTICGGEKAQMTWQERMCMGFNQMHTALLNIRAAVADAGPVAGSAMRLVEEMELKALGPMHRLRNRFGIPFDWTAGE